jgi:hypothetical protein
LTVISSCGATKPGHFDVPTDRRRPRSTRARALGSAPTRPCQSGRRPRLCKRLTARTAAAARGGFARMRQTPGTVANGPASLGLRGARPRNSVDTGTRPAAPATPAPAAPPSRWPGGQLRAQRQREQARLNGLTTQVLRLLANP